MNKIILGSLVATIVILLGTIQILTERAVVKETISLAKWTITCNPTYGAILTYDHFGSRPIPDSSNNLSIISEYGKITTLYNMNNCVIHKAVKSVPQLQPRITPSKLSTQPPIIT